MTFGRVACIGGENAELCFLFQNGIPEDQIVDLQDHAMAVEEGLKTASGLIRDLSLPRVGRQFHSLEVRQEGGQQILKIEFTATRAR
jgi:hypothetical protein